MPMPSTPSPAVRLRRLLCAFALALALLPALALAEDEDLPPGGGDAPAAPGPRASDLSGDLRIGDIRKAAGKVAAWQLARVEPHPSLDWTFAPLYLGFLSAGDLLHEPRYEAYVRSVGERFGWGLGPRVRHADDQAVAQSWLQLHARHPDPAMLQPLRQRYDAQMRQPDDPKRPLWWWCDALFMAPPAWAGLAEATHRRDYLDYMDRQWWITSRLLYDEREHLFSRDASYLDRRERNGSKLFWSRGNGWALAGLARVLERMPADYPGRDRYLRQFRDMAARLAALQGRDGLWRPGLLDADGYPRPEVSGSAFIAYALAWGVHHRVLDARTYRPVIGRAWRGLVGQIYADGRLGNIQPIGAAPGQYPASASYVYGVGAFLLAAGEVAAIAGQAPRR
ncbi:glycosyl hydrolase [Frateuria sp. Soil773]|uniref:glycoside hydrolase family 88/105 protein n=1 Tax=Frateuria sp. Soil773 TaxID=1736407 RepID=UPI0006F43154|nr:glycoside hydrolase family 88 protein [Frateuria sp. Soil773]KRE97853.1 glycosyl hydrolase [Frateuria sp. Soil773]